MLIYGVIGYLFFKQLLKYIQGVSKRVILLVPDKKGVLICMKSVDIWITYSQKADFLYVEENFRFRPKFPIVRRYSKTGHFLHLRRGDQAIFGFRISQLKQYTVPTFLTQNTPMRSQNDHEDVFYRFLKINFFYLFFILGDSPKARNNFFWKKIFKHEFQMTFFWKIEKEN